MTSAIATPRRTTARIASGLLALGLTGCVSFVEIPVETPLAPKLDVTRFKRLLVAGFVVERSDDIDLEELLAPSRVDLLSGALAGCLAQDRQCPPRQQHRQQCHSGPDQELGQGRAGCLHGIQ